MIRIKMHISKVKLPFDPPCEVKCGLQNRVSTRVDNPIIKISEEDARYLHHPHDDALVISIWVGDYKTHRVLVDNRSFADILYYLAFQQMRIDKKRLVPTNTPLVGFGGTKVYPL